MKRIKLVSQLSLTDIEFQSHTFETMKWITKNFTRKNRAVKALNIDFSTIFTSTMSPFKAALIDNDPLEAHYLADRK